MARDFDKLNKDDIYHNNELAFRVAEHHLGIPALLEAEDMVEYEVPDRLSILTYMSQFYQTFEVQRGKSGARVAPKRPQSSPDHGIVSPASTSPPTKVQITIGKARREPCAKCGLPVFIAERLNVGKLLYHRTCFRCARCQSQLTLANYYETESGEFCCEICPDEEKLISKKISSEHSVLLRSMSDEEKSASLLSFSEAPDAYSTHFETALEFPLDGELKKSFTLAQNVSSQARSKFFSSQLEESGSDSGGENLPPDLPSSKPPSLPTVDPGEKNDHSIVSESSGFSSYKPDSNLVSDSASEQTNNHFVTKDNVSSSGGVSVRARMKLFENNEDKKSDVNRFSPSKQVPLASAIKKKATVVAIDDLEDFDNVSKKSVELEGAPPEQNFTAETPIVKDDIVELDEKTDKSKDSNIVLDDNAQTNDEHISINSETSTKSVETTEPIKETMISEKVTTSISDDSYLTCNDNAQDELKSPIIIDDSVIIIEDSLERPSPNFKSPREERSVIQSEDSKPQTEESSDIMHSEEMIIASTDSKPQTEESSDVINSEEMIIPSTNFKPQTEESSDVLLSKEMIIPSVSSKPQTEESPDMMHSQEMIITEQSVEDNIGEQMQVDDKANESSETPLSDIDPNELNKNDSVESSLKEELHLPVSSPIESPKTEDRSDTSQNEAKTYPTDLNPFGEDEEENAGTSVTSGSLNPFGEPNDEEEEVISPRPTPAPRPKKKIIPTMEEREIAGTPESLARIYTQRISINPFEDDEDVLQETKPVPSPRQKKKLTVPIKISLNPFESDEEEDQIVPVPKPRTSKSTISSLPEAKSRDALSVASRGSHGGSNSSISSGSNMGSARKKKPAPRPPMPFRTDHSASSSVTASPNPSVVHSPNLSGTIRSRKTKRAPLPPNASTPAHDPKEVSDRLTNEISPIYSHDSLTNVAENEDISKDKNTKDEENRNRQSLNLSNENNDNDTDSNLSVPNKSTLGRWKRKKGQAPSRPIPQRRIVKTLPMSEIRRELDTIEIQQQGLEKQGVRLEQIIREKCEGTESSATDDVPIEVEDLILQLFELVNEKNELFRRQAELMYLRRQQRLEEEYADVEYQIRCLMMQPEANKTDSDKAKEEVLINRLVEIVERRNEIIECLEMDRVREAEEDNSISSQLNLYSMKRDGDKYQPSFEEKKEKKKKLKKIKKIIPSLHKHKEKEKDYKADIDKDVDETESSAEKKKKKKFLF
ncbi:hypothetical protein GWI33_006401 [Rhynchophorus ferrugineus]|uniref:MICAL-like protein 1 n=1 Tax=Rhynchophorus ferrugineus TaxID=354439 RepID=A0A834IKE6_RHYFE|nr:hypothetical protein GWI33_006401 [Rhynchophorus ferrugineus]